MENLKLQKIFENKTFTTIFVVFTTVFAAHIAPRLPKKILQLFNTNIAKIIFMTFIAYAATKNMSIALVVSIALIILMQSLRKLESRKMVINKIAESTQITSDAKINLINNLLADNNTEPEQKMSLFKNISSSLASPKHKLNSGLILIKSEPSEIKTIISHLYSGIDNTNKVNLTYRLCDKKKIRLNHMDEIVKHLKDSTLDENTKTSVIENIKQKFNI